MSVVELACSGLVGKIKDFVYEKSDLHFTSKKDSFFERRLRERMELVGAVSCEAYYYYMVENPQEVQALAAHLTTNQTYFFRNAEQFRALEGSVVPAIVEARNLEVMRGWVKNPPAPGRHPAMKVRVWSAGCSTGEEAYSIAFTLLNSIRYPKAWDMEVLATDINRDVLETARRGIYPAEALRHMEAAMASRYMEPCDDAWSVSAYARGIAGFYQSNIKDVTGGNGRTMVLTGADGVPRELDAEGRFDVIFCRNVMIYFDRQGQQRLVDALYDCLRPGGYLFTGDSEPLHLFRHGFLRAEDDKALYYRKPG